MGSISSFAKLLEYDVRIKRLEVDGSDEVAKYFFEHPDKLSERIRDIERIREEIVFSDIEQKYKEDYLHKLNRTISILKPPSQSNYNPFLLIGIGFVLGVIGKSIFDYSIDGLLKTMEEGFNEGFQQRLKEYAENENSAGI